MRNQLAELRQHRGFSALAISRFISNVGNGISPVALAFGVLALPGATAKDLSIVMAARMFPMIALMLFGGVIGDRFKRNRIVGGADIIGSTFATVSAVSLIVSHSSVFLLALMGALFGILNALWWPAMSGVLPEILPKEKLQHGNAVVSMTTNIGYVAGALLGGILVTAFGSGWALLVDAISFFIAGIIVWNLDLPTIIRENKNTVFYDLKTGWHEFSSRSWVVTIVIAFAVINLAYEALLQVLGPLNFSKMDNGPQFWSFNLATLTIGMLTGSVISLKVHFGRPLLFAMLIISATAIWDFSLAFQTPLVISLICAFLAGIAIDIFMVIWNTSLQSHIPEESYSRVVAYDAFGSFGLSPLGIAIVGPLAQAFGVSTMIYVTGAMTLLAALASLLVKSVRDLKPVVSP
ncbi:ProP Permeases of the major facilitator superfamily [Candidatus Nanopelagicaceae bacterium]